MTEKQVLGKDVCIEPRGRPPIFRTTAKRGSLPDIRLKGRKLDRHPVHTTLVKSSGSYNNLEKPLSLTHLENIKLNTRALSASNLAALSDSNLSLREAIPARSYEVLNTDHHFSKRLFEQLIKRYYYQLTKGCGDEQCQNRFCKSCKDGLILNPVSAAVASIELVTQNRPYLCTREKFIGQPLPKEIFTVENGKIKPFIYAMLQASPFKSLYEESPQVKEDILSRRTVTNSQNDRFNGIRRASFSGSISKDVKTGNKDHTPFHTDSMGDLLMLTNDYLRRSKRNILFSSGDLFRTSSSAHLHTSTPISTPLNLSLSFSNSSQDSVVSPHNSSPMQVYDGDDKMMSQLEEYESQLAVEIAVGDVKELSLTHMTLTSLRSAIDKMKETKDSSFLLNSIRTIFTSPEALNNSFKINESLAATPSNLDMTSVHEAFTLLHSLTLMEEFQTMLLNCLEVLLLTLAKSSITIQHINQVLILINCPLFRKRRHSTLRQRLCHVIASMHIDSKVQLTQVLSEYKTDIFEKKIMGIYRDHFMLMLKSGQRSEPDLIDVAQTLEVFYCANMQAINDMGQSIVPLKLFYVHELSRKLNFKDEYDVWRSRKEVSTSTSQSSLLDYPFLMDPSSKVHILHLDAVVSMRKEYQEAILHQARVNQIQKYLRVVNRSLNLTDSIKSAMCPFLVLEIEREYMLRDTLAQIKLKHIDLKKPLKIKYIGGGEQGLDMGGVQKEFFQLVCAKIFDTSYGMFTYSDESHTLWFNGACDDCEEEFELVGVIFGLAIYNGVILDVRFPLALYKKLQGHMLELADLIEYMPTVGRGLKDLLEYTEDDVEDVFDLTFQISVEIYGQVKCFDLIPNGGYVPVTNQNHQKYVKAYMDFLLCGSIKRQFEAFKRGFLKVCSMETLSLFRPDEIELLVCGSPDLDFSALEKSVTYDDGYHIKHQTIQSFWSIVHELSDSQKKLLLHFITGSDRVPLKGLAHLPIVIQKSGSDEERLPTAMTCFNRLLLPAYSTQETLRKHLITAIENGKGFGLT